MKHWTGPDVVAVVLSVGLAAVASLIMLGTIVQILHGNPEVTLSENATQILIASVSGLTGVLGGYMGYRLGTSGPPGPRRVPDLGPPVDPREPYDGELDVTQPYGVPRA